MTKVVLIRHGRSTANAAGILAGRTDVPLDDLGRAQAEALRALFDGVSVAAAYTSPIARCRETAALAGFPDATVIEGVSECDYGDWTGLPLKDLAQQEIWEQIRRAPTTVSFPGGESIAAMFDRVSEVIGDLAARHGDDDVILLFSHGDPIKAIISRAFGMADDDFQRVHVAPGGVSVIDHRDPFPVVLCVNAGGDVASHLAVSTGPVVGGGDVAKA